MAKVQVLAAETTMTHFTRMEKGDQPRDADGKFGSGGGEGPRAEDKFNKGQKVKTRYGETKTVASVNHPMVTTTDGSDYHHTKVFAS
jgi:hypothetical protein